MLANTCTPLPYTVLCITGSTRWERAGEGDPSCREPRAAIRFANTQHLRGAWLPRPQAGGHHEHVSCAPTRLAYQLAPLKLDSEQIPSRYAYEAVGPMRDSPRRTPSSAMFERLLAGSGWTLTFQRTLSLTLSVNLPAQVLPVSRGKGRCPPLEVST